MSSTTILNVRVEHLRDASGIGVECPRLSWRVGTDSQGWQQTAYEIEAYQPDG
jgi:alpha-L-rhamnosidase